MTMRTIALGVAALLAMASIAAAQSARVRDSAGVRIVESGPRATAPITFVADTARVSDIGGLKPDPTTELNTSTFTFRVARLSDGTRVLGDWSRLRFSDAFDMQIRHAGREGRGPGEFGSVNGLCVTRGDTIVATDAVTGRVSIWTAAGSFVRDFAGGHRTLRGCFADGTFLVSTDSATGVVLERRGLLESDVRRLGFFGGSAPRSRFASARSISVQTSVATAGSRFYVADPAESEVRVYELPGTLVRIIRTNDPPAMITAREADVLLDDAASAGAAGTTGGAPQPAPARPSREARPTGIWPAFAEIKVDDAGRLWMRDIAKSRAAPVVWSGFDTDGRLLGKFSLPAQTRIGDPFALAFTRDGVLVRREDSDGAVHLVELRWKRP